MLLNSQRHYEATVLNEKIFETVTSFNRLKIMTNDLRHSDSPIVDYQMWLYFREKFSQALMATMDDPQLALELERYGSSDILPSIRTNWELMNRKMGEVDSQIFSAGEEYHLAVNNLYVIMSNSFERQLNSLYESFIVNSRKALLLFNRITVATVFLSVLVLILSLLLITNRMSHVQADLDSKRLEARDATINALAYQAELRDDETGKHIERTALYIELLAREMAKYSEYANYLGEEYISDLKISAPLHDIGKVGISDNILLKPGPLSDEEFEIMKTHPLLGAKSLRRVEASLGFSSFLELAIELIESHHEKWDGTGYPYGLKGQTIPLSGRLMALADVYDALSSERVYKSAFPHSKCVEIIRSQEGAHFDPQIVEAFLAVEKEFEKISLSMKDG
ncbi:MAG: HD domain-containing protein [Spirochaetales bacterium]|nr:HD domain-containing protein [Spirochaetales bacterium]